MPAGRPADRPTDRLASRLKAVKKKESAMMMMGSAICSALTKVVFDELSQNTD